MDDVSYFRDKLIVFTGTGTLIFRLNSLKTVNKVEKNNAKNQIKIQENELKYHRKHHQ